MSEKYNVSKEEKIRQAEFADKVKTVLAAEFYEHSPKAFIHTYGCQGNVSDSERIMGMLKEMGYEFTNDASNPRYVTEHQLFAKGTDVFGNGVPNI